ncbi:MAG: hypothetical protein ACHQ0J_07115 [Candidatus Dormibacterales bacterium]
MKKRGPRPGAASVRGKSRRASKEPARTPEPPAAREGSVRVPPRRLASPLSRLTIKPGQSVDPHPVLELSTRPRPSGPRPLSQVELDEDEVLLDGFDATLDGRRVRVTAVLERTCVYIDRSGDRRLVRKEDLTVEADRLPIRRRGFA